MSQEFTYSDIAEHNTKKVSRTRRQLLGAWKRRIYTKKTRKTRILDKLNKQSSNF
jgi:hypothetical protein